MTDQNMANLVAIVHDRAVAAVVQGIDTTESINQLISINCPLSMKYKVLDIVTLIKENSANIGELKKISHALNILEKYARHLLKPVESRSNMWRFVKFSNQIFKDRVDAIKGGRDIMRQMGYVQDIEDGLAFPDGAVADHEKLSRLVTDIILGKRELDAYFNGSHPHPQYINELVHQNTL
ncbi:hypothetical protein KUTeg_019580 [Tegillarca granosa]|uniref:PUB domain-containing protein n=1 Tax=Tegillarca granosa TaxID=220873 RepID=A0ABQ9ECY6_TEGGR|nr:hypothetical protein KUTeg_019580 [Tegillarca granosa]